MEFTLANLGLGPGSSFDYVATYISNTAYRSNEFNGVAAYGGVNPGWNPVSLVAGDFNTFRSAAGEITPLNNGGTGPGGVGVPDGSGTLELWLKADTGAYTDASCTTAAANGQDVACWGDQSGKGNHVTQSNSSYRPTYRTGSQNGQPALQNQGSTLSGDVLYRATTAFTGDPAYSVFFAFNCTSSVMGDNLFAVGSPATADSFAYHTHNPDGNRGLYHFNQGQVPGSRIYGWHINSHRYFARSGTDAYFHTDGSLVASTDFPALSIPNTDQVISIGGWSNRSDNPWGNEFTGYTGEAIFYTRALNDVERILVENYLSAKYAVALTADDVYDGDTAGNGDFDLNVAGIGQAGGVAHPQAHAAGMIVRNATFLQEDGDWLLFGHRTAANATVTTDLPTTGDWVGKTGSQRMERHFYIDLTDASGVTGGTVDLIFDFSDAGLAPWNLVAGNYRLLKRSGTTGAFGDIATASAVVGDQVHFYGVNVSLLGSNFTLGGVGEPTAVTLTRFAATPAGDGVQVTWETAQELEHLGFNLYRGSGSTGPWVRLNAELLPAQNPGATSGGTYTWLDAGATPGAPSYYRLEDVDIYGVSTFHGPVAATPEGPAAISVVGLGTRAPLGGFALLALGTAALGTAVLRARRKSGAPD